ncbi:energy-coupling factor transporter transmembrane protein EcfT [Microvirga tunisiensis]|uniref:Energy-coupling factor transporter transmembrane protein EcfT n=2 Tax=Pannonibacter tanglangensis TaxID=2750084 RepID=A0ABW9ZLA3_9HYPH|nr:MULTISPECIES: energy-coupling factor transporter transmembrane protein EcfT [unclassified Pannonibacter]NBN65478.1 energy-coupling factor transporter transmembrane protein EcfT [Pannonibacter sp. XCT-34]NBN80295.1 energy-coupling factor transporter transmembrane protein EcfT [Pannonibacter sp. XCT-53]
MLSLFVPGTSFAHRTPAGVKMILLAAVSALLMPVGNAFILAAALAGAASLYAVLGREGWRQMRLLRPLLPMLLLIAGLHGLMGTPMEGLTVVLRLLTMVLLANFVTLTTRMDDMMAALLPLFRPLALVGLSPRRPALAVSLVLRFIPLLLAVYGALGEAYRARTGRAGSWRLIAPLAIQALKLSDHVAEALIARGGADGLSGTHGRTRVTRR